METYFAWMLVGGLALCALCIAGCLVALYELYRDRNRGMATYDKRLSREMDEYERIQKQLREEYDEVHKRG